MMYIVIVYQLEPILMMQLSFFMFRGGWTMVTVMIDIRMLITAI
ncbi:MAG: hypothetical protein Q4F06_01530 [Eubacteriales bacterium]|nr:hypothetical protein [Eubacteriales bacterium]